MPTVKLVVIGSSGVGKTSMRGKYISGRFSTGYRATIGADFITKTLPHPADPNQTITLQIWDTAGQERFSSLSTAFFRGADAALLMFDVNNPSTMHAMTKWWADFCDKAPVDERDVAEYCCVVVGNKIDMVSANGISVSESEALEFLDDLVPPGDDPPEVINVLPPEVSSNSNGSPQGTDEEDEEPAEDLSASQLTITAASSSTSVPDPDLSVQPPPKPHRSPSIAITAPIRPSHSREPSHSPKHHLSKSRSRSSSRFYAGTMTTTHTTLTIYHTPSSSLFDSYQSARSSPEPWTASRSEPDLTQIAVPGPSSPNGSVRQRRLTMLSTGSTSSGSGATITPSLFRDQEHREHANGNGTANGNGALPTSHSSPNLPLNLAKHTAPLPPERGPKLFFTSAKTGEGVKDVFEYIAHRVVRKWEYEEWVESRRMHFRESTTSGGSTLLGGSTAADHIRLERGRGTGKGVLNGCCSG